MREVASLGCDVRLLTVETLRDADWPKDILTEFLMMPEGLTPNEILNTVTYLARTRHIDRIVALDEFDMEVAALLREHMRLPGMGETITRYFRDKLAMRMQARRGGIKAPEFTPVIEYTAVAAFMRDVPEPWFLKPRMNAAAIGIKPIGRAEELWPILEELGDLQSHYVLERFIAGEVFHVDGVTWGGKVLFAAPCKYGRPPFETMHKGGIFTTRTLAPDSADYKELVEIHAALLGALHMQSGVSHAEFIKSSEDGQFYFLEVAARVGGAYIADTVELATGVNPWVEWARLEVAQARGDEYQLPSLKTLYAGAVISLARQETPDLSAYTDPEIALRLHKVHHAGLLLASPSGERIKELLDSYTERFLRDFNAVIAAPEKPTS